MVVKPQALRPGDDVALVAPACMPPGEDLNRAIDLLATRYNMRTYRDLPPRSWGIFAGSHEERKKELTWALTTPGIKAVLAVRGGYGTMRSIDMSVLDRMQDHPRAVMGFSDITALLCGLWTRSSMVSIHGPMVWQIGRGGKEALYEMAHILESNEPAPPITDLAPLREGKAVGRLIGGNLTVLAHTLGTGLFPDLNGAVLVVEDVNERPYHIDRCFTQLRLAGALEGLSGLVAGQFTACKPIKGEHTVAKTLELLAQELNIPALAGLQAGHGAPNRPIPVGVQVKLDADQGTLTFVEPHAWR